jgi:DNA-directed RNA polymerase specialized sigma24 family protein
MKMSQFNFDFQQIKQRIYRYSLKITSNRWEAEDLTQDVLLKVYKAMEAKPSREVSNVYLYRIALTTWKDKRKKREPTMVSFDGSHIAHSNTDMQLSTRELLEVLAHRLSPRASVEDRAGYFRPCPSMTKEVSSPNGFGRSGIEQTE